MHIKDIIPISIGWVFVKNTKAQTDEAVALVLDIFFNKKTYLAPFKVFISSFNSHAR